ncbi:ATP-dependent Clp protease ATP-binding subunit [Candidatus Uhrbacteria bacterium]|nr:ATP-dependent Clp protease ATP-binding subunit [Candidatus Uhrbacteria bacterium]
MPFDIVDKFSTHLKNVLTRALCFAVEMNEKSIEPEHLLWALGTQKGSIGAELLKKSGIKQQELRSFVGATQKIKTKPKMLGDSTLNLSNDAKRIVEKAVLTANIYGHRYVGTEHLLSGIIQAGGEIIDQFFQMQKTDIKTLKQQLSIVLKNTSKFPDIAGAIVGADGKNTSPITTISEEETNKIPALEFFGRELTDPEVQKTIDPVIGRENEIERLMQILCRRTKNNPLLLGAPGVGKTAIVEGLAKRVVDGNAPSALLYKRIFSIDLALMIAGTMYRGEFEGRLRQIIDEVKKNSDIILFIDEVHTIVGAGAASGSMDAANILKPALARGEIHCIGATTAEDYKKHLESDSALERRFQTIFVEEPSLEEAQTILQGLAPHYEKFHNVRFSPDALIQAVKLSARYLQDRQLPDKAIDLIDEAASAIRLNFIPSASIQNRYRLEKELNRVRETKRQAVVEERFLDAVELKEQEEHMRFVIETSSQEEGRGSVPIVTEKDIAQIISRITGIPLNELTQSSISNAKEIEERLSQRIFGQERTISSVAGALARAKTGVVHPKRPLGSFLFLGPSGVGKTELAKAIAREFFHDEKNFVRLDMSEYSEGFTISKLIGAPAGYVGYKDQANLTDRVKQRPYSVVLFDEMEKAHRDVQNLLLQILEEGELTDATGRRVNFKNTIIVMTSNIGMEKFEHGSIGFGGSSEDKRASLYQDIRKELEERFRPEFVNRIETMCIFESLPKSVLTRIIEKELNELIERMKEQHTIALSVDPELATHLSQSLDPRLGARSVRQKIQTDVETKIAERLAKKDRPSKLCVEIKNGMVCVIKVKSNHG